MKVTIHSILESKPEAFNGLTQTNFTTEEAPTTSHYIFSKPGNAPQVGDVLEGEITKDKAGRNKFTKAKAENVSYHAPGSPNVFPVPLPTKTFKADPDKMKQEFSLEVAKNLSIQRQVALKAAVDLINAGQVAFTGLDNTFDHLMVLLNPKYEAPQRIPDEPYDEDDDLDDIDFSGIPE